MKILHNKKLQSSIIIIICFTFLFFPLDSSLTVRVKDTNLFGPSFIHSAIVWTTPNNVYHHYI